MSIRDLDEDNFDHGPFDFLRGACITAFAAGYGTISSFGGVPPSLRGTWRSAWKKAAIDAFDSTTHIVISGEHLAYYTNYLDLDPTYRDAYGDPLLRMTWAPRRKIRW